jgi:hypothetical protein
VNHPRLRSDLGRLSVDGRLFGSIHRQLHPQSILENQT